MHTDDQRRPRGILALVCDRSFGPFLLARMGSTAGVWTYNVAAAIVVFDITNSTLWVAAVSVAQFAPQFVITPWSGSHADRGNRRAQMVAGRLVVCLGASALVVISLGSAMAGRTMAAAVVGSAFVVGVGFAIGSPAIHATLPALVRPTELSVAIALNSIPATVARSAGPALAGALIAYFGAPVAFSFTAITSAAFVAVVARIRIRNVARTTPHDTSIRAALNHLRTDQTTVLLAGAVAISFGADPAITLAPAIASELGGGPVLVGWLGSAFGIGAALSVVTIGWLGHRVNVAWSNFAGLVAMGVGLIGLALAATVTYSLVSLFVAGLGLSAAITGLTTMMQQRSPEELRGRIMALWTLSYLGSRPLAAAVSGSVAEVAGLRTALVVVAAVLASFCWLLRPSRLAHATRALPTEASSA